MIVTKDNYESLFPNSGTTFQSIINGRFVPQRKMKKEGSFTQIRYLTVQDMMDIALKRIETDSSYNKTKNKKKWDNIVSQAKNILARETMDKDS